jgi:hypothetical protein
MKTRFIFLMLGLLAFFSCEEIIQLDLDTTPEKIVIEGLLTNRFRDQYVKVSKTSGFYDSKATQLISNAIVSVVDSDGTLFRYGQASPGFYVPTTNLTGQVGKTYKLSVRIGDQVYESEDQLLRLSPIDSLGYALTENPTDERKEKGQLYDLLMYFQEPKDSKDYYLFKFYRNDTLTYTNSNDIYLANDEVLSESIKGFPAPVFYAEKDTARMEMFSVTRNGYLFLSDLTNLQFSDGGLFGPVPANPRTNISNGALGFFQVSSVRSAQVILRKKR